MITVSSLSEYYVPNQKDLFLGFKCDLLYDTLDNKVVWREHIFEETDFLNAWKYIGAERIRVKSLDKEDIINTGFKKTFKNWWVGYEDYVFCNFIKGEYGYYLSATLHISRFDKMHKILVHRHYDETNPDVWDSREETLQQGDSKVVYEGKIPSINELQ